MTINQTFSVLGFKTNETKNIHIKTFVQKQKKKDNNSSDNLKYDDDDDVVVVVVRVVASYNNSHELFNVSTLECCLFTFFVSEF